MKGAGPGRRDITQGTTQNILYGNKSQHRWGSSGSLGKGQNTSCAGEERAQQGGMHIWFSLFYEDPDLCADEKRLDITLCSSISIPCTNLAALCRSSLEFYFVSGDGSQCIFLLSFVYGLINS